MDRNDSAFWDRFLAFILISLLIVCMVGASYEWVRERYRKLLSLLVRRPLCKSCGRVVPKPPFIYLTHLEYAFCSDECFNEYKEEKWT